MTRFPCLTKQQRPSLAFSYRAAVLLLALPILLAFGLRLATAAAVEELTEEEKQRGVRQVKQDGYVEKIDPNVDYKDRLPTIPPRHRARCTRCRSLIRSWKAGVHSS